MNRNEIRRQAQEKLWREIETKLAYGTESENAMAMYAQIAVCILQTQFCRYGHQSAQSELEAEAERLFQLIVLKPINDFSETPVEGFTPTPAEQSAEYTYLCHKVLKHCLDLVFLGTRNPYG